MYACPRHSQRGAFHIIGSILILLVVAVLYGVSDYVQRLKRVEYENAVLMKRMDGVEQRLKQMDSFGFNKP